MCVCDVTNRGMHVNVVFVCVEIECALFFRVLVCIFENQPYLPDDLQSVRMNVCELIDEPKMHMQFFVRPTLCSFFPVAVVGPSII